MPFGVAGAVVMGAMPLGMVSVLPMVAMGLVLRINFCSAMQLLPLMLTTRPMLRVVSSARMKVMELLLTLPLGFMAV